MTVAGFLSVVINVFVATSPTMIVGRPNTFSACVVVVVYIPPAELYTIIEPSKVENAEIEGTSGATVGLQ